MDNRTINFAEDSQIRDLGVVVGLFSQGQSVEDSPDVKFDKRSKGIWSYCTKIGYTLNLGIIKRRGVNDCNGFLFPKKEYADEHSDWKWQIQVWEIYCNHMIRPGSLKQVLSNEMIKRE